MDTKILLIIHVVGCLIFPVVACSTEKEAQEVLSNTKIIEYRLIVDKNMRNDYCRDWNPSKLDIENIFKHSTFITTEERHKKYDWGGCSVVGKLGYKNIEYTFEINVAGVGVLTDENGAELTTGCLKSCKKYLDFGFIE